jgi:Ca-activated chloride channel family protein
MQPLRNVRLSVAVVLLMTAVAAGAPGAQDDASGIGHTIQVDVARVLLNVSVKTKKGRPIPGLQAEDFLVFEDGVQQSLLSFSATDRPLTLAFVIDNSRSMRTQQAEVINGVVKLAMLRHAGDHTLAVQFSDSFTAVAPPGRPLTHLELRDRLISLYPDGMTSLYDGVAHALSLAERGPHQRQALVVLSDGGDTASEITLESLMEKLRRSNAIVYAVGLSTPDNRYNSPGALRKIADVSGGAAFFPSSHENLMAVCERIAEEIRSQYTLSYAPTNTRREGVFRTVEVHLRPGAARKAVVQTREGYFEPR